MRLVAAVLLLTSVLPSCKYITSWSEVATRSASSDSVAPAAEPCMLALSSGRSCRISEKRCEQAIRVLTDVRNRPVSAQREILSDVFVQAVIRKNTRTAELLLNFYEANSRCLKTSTPAHEKAESASLKNHQIPAAYASPFKKHTQFPDRI